MKKLAGALWRWGSLALAVAPTAIVIVMAIRAWLLNDRSALDSPIWLVVALQVGAIALFCWHALDNKRLRAGGAGDWTLRFVFLVPFGMIDYWRKYLWRVER